MDNIPNNINVDKVLNDTKSYLINQIKNSKIFAGDLLAKTGDEEGYRKLISNLDLLIDILEGRSNG